MGQQSKRVGQTCQALRQGTSHFGPLPACAGDCPSLAVDRACKRRHSNSVPPQTQKDRPSCRFLYSVSHELAYSLLLRVFVGSLYD
jgi:hypothetical protein